MTIELSKDARASLDAICDTFVPGENGLPAATEPTCPGRDPGGDGRQSERRRPRRVRGTDRGVGLRLRRSLPKEEREQALLSWCDSDDVMQRAAFQALRKLTMVMYYIASLGGRGPQPRRRGDRLPRPAREAPRRPEEEDRAAVDQRGHRARLRRGRGRVGRRRWNGGRGARPGRPRRRGGRGGRLLQRGGLRRRRARRLRAALPGRRRRADARPEHGAARRLLPRRGHNGQLHLVFSSARPRS